MMRYHWWDPVLLAGDWYSNFWSRCLIVPPFNPFDEIMARLKNVHSNFNASDRNRLQDVLFDQACQEYSPTTEVLPLNAMTRCGECTGLSSPMIAVTNNLNSVACGIKPWMLYWSCPENSHQDGKTDLLIMCPRCLMGGRRCSSCPKMVSYITQDWNTIIAIINQPAKRQPSAKARKAVHQE